MALVDVVRNGVKIAANLTRSFQESVTHVPWIGQDGAGKDLPGTPVVRRALVDRTGRPVEISSGVLITIIATITFLDPIEATTANAGQTRVNPIDPRDNFILADGTTAPVVLGGGFNDAGTGSPFVNTVKLGR